MSEEKRSYGQILRSSSIVGGAQAINYVIGLVRVKVVALLIGPAGVGFLGAYTSAIALVGAVSDFGVGPSAIREIAHAHSGGNPEELARIFAMLRRILLATGVFGWVLAILFYIPLSELLTGLRYRAADRPCRRNAPRQLVEQFAGEPVAGREAHWRLRALQSLWRSAQLRRDDRDLPPDGRLGDRPLDDRGLARRARLLGVFFAARRARSRQGEHEADRVLLSQDPGLSLSIMWNGILWAGVDMLVRSLIMRGFGAEAAGNYQAAWTLTGVFANVVLTGMASDFFPRLVGMIDDEPQAARAINQQTEIGVLLALPSLLFAAAFARSSSRSSIRRSSMPRADCSLGWPSACFFASCAGRCGTCSSPKAPRIGSPPRRRSPLARRRR